MLGTQMQSVGEAMSIGRTFPEIAAEGAALARAGSARAQLRSGGRPASPTSPTTTCSPASIRIATPERIFQIGELLDRGVSIETIHEACRVDPWFLDQMQIITEEQARARRDRLRRDMTDAGVAARQAARVRRRPARAPVGRRTKTTCAPPARRPGSSRPTRPSTRARPSSPRRRRTTTRPTRTRARSARATAARS